MNLNDLVAASPAKHYKKILEGHFGHKISVDSLTAHQATSLLKRVRGLLGECRSNANAHFSERDPKYVKLIVVEQALMQYVYENTIPAQGSTTTAPPTPAQQQQVKSQQLQTVQKIKDPKLQQAMKKSVSGQTLSKDEQQTVTGAMMGSPVAENKGWRLYESEVQQAQVILASQDLVDQVQKMIEQCTSIQFKDLPALVNQIKNEIGYDQAVQFNNDANAALSTLVQSMQGAKQQLEGAVGVVTGQQANIPMPTDTGLGAAPAAPAAPDAGMDMDMDMDFEEPAVGGDQATFGRDRVSESRKRRRKL